MYTMNLATCVKLPDISKKFLYNFPFRAMGTIISHPLLWDATAMVCPPLLPARSGTASTCELTDYKCLKTTSVSHVYTFWMHTDVNQSWSTLYFKRVLEGTSLSQDLLRNNNIFLLLLNGATAYSCHICDISAKQLDRAASWFSCFGWTDGVPEGKGNCQMQGSRTNG